MQQIFNKRFLLPLLIILGGLYIYSLPGRPPDIDDAWIGEHAYWLAREGHVRSVLMSGVTGQEERLVVHHKLLTLHGALFIKIFGFSLYSIKSVSLLYFFLFLVLFYIYTVKVRRLFDMESWYFAMLLLLVFPWTFKYSFLFRPEIMVMTLAFLSFVLIERSVTSSRGRYLDLFLAGMVAGLAFAGHLNGAVVVGAGGLLLLFNKDFRGLAVFIPGALITSAIYLYDLTPEYGFGYWLYQFRESPSLDSIAQVPAALQPLINLLSEHRRFFHNPEIIVFSVFMFTVVGAGFRSVLKEYRNITLFAVFLFLLTALLAVHKSRQYILMYYPFLVIMITLNMRKILAGDFRRASAPWFRRFTMVLFAIFVAGSTISNMRLAGKKFSPKENRSLTLHHVEGDPSSLKVVAPMTFIFNEIEYYEAIVGEVSFTERQKMNGNIYKDGFLQLAEKEGLDYILLSPYYRHRLGLDTLPAREDMHGYRKVHENEELLILSSR